VFIDLTPPSEQTRIGLQTVPGIVSSLYERKDIVGGFISFPMNGYVTNSTVYGMQIHDM